MKKKLIAILLIAALVLGISITVFARDSSHEPEPTGTPVHVTNDGDIIPFAGDSQWHRHTISVEHLYFEDEPRIIITDSFGTEYSVDNPLVPACIVERALIKASPDWDGTMPYIPSTLYTPRNEPFVIDTTTYDFRTRVEQFYYEDEPRIYIFNFYGEEISLDDRSLPTHIVEDALSLADNFAALTLPYVNLTAQNADNVMSSCWHPNRHRILRQTVNHRACATFCWRRDYIFTIYCNSCRAQVGAMTETASQAHPSWRTVPNQPSLETCTSCNWVRIR